MAGVIKKDGGYAYLYKDETTSDVVATIDEARALSEGKAPKRVAKKTAKKVAKKVAKRASRKK